jgi:hypothetical protein
MFSPDNMFSNQFLEFPVALSLAISSRKRLNDEINCAPACGRAPSSTFPYAGVKLPRLRCLDTELRRSQTWRKAHHCGNRTQGMKVV